MYRMALLLWGASSETEADFPQAWSECRSAIGRFDLDGELNLSEWVDVVDSFIKQGRCTPNKIALISSTQLRADMEGHCEALAAHQLWTAAALLFADLSSDPLLALKGAPENAGKIISRLNAAAL